MSKYFVVDTETATINGPIVDLAVIEINRNLDIVSEVESLIDPLARIVPAAEAVHGISQAMIENEPTIAEFLERDGNPFAHDGDIFVIGHNVQFDCRMFTQAGMLPAQYTKVCTLRMARNWWPDLDEQEANHKLGTLAVMLDLERGPAHRAKGDAITCLNLLRWLAASGQVDTFDDLIALGTRSLSLDTRITFSKHRGTRLGELPLDYVRWLCGQKDMDPDLRAALACRLR